MIRKVNASDSSVIMDYLKDEPSMNLFIIGDIENFGYDADFFDVWAEFDGSGCVRGVMIRYDGSFIPYSKGNFDAEGFADIIKGSQNIDMFSGKGSVTQKFESIPDLDIGKKKPSFLCELKDGSKLRPVDRKVKKAEIGDINGLINLRCGISEFDTRENYRESMERTFLSKSGRTYYIKEDGKIVSSASTTAENSVSAMVVGVCTHIDYRKKGYASMCMNALCRELLNEGKTACLFYNNPDAGRIYRRLGFKEIGIWNMYKKDYSKNAARGFER